MGGSCKDCIHNGLCIVQIKDSDWEGNISGCSRWFSDKSEPSSANAHVCSTCKYYGSSHKRMPCKGCINNGVSHADYHEHFKN